MASSRVADRFSILLIILGVLVSDTVSDLEEAAYPTDIGDVAFIILSQPESFHILRAQKIKSSLEEQAKKLKWAAPSVTLLHEQWPGKTGAWTVQPLLTDLAEKFSKFRWLFFCEDQTSINLAKLLEVLKRFDPSKEQFLGKALRDSIPTIIHHFAFHDNPSSFAYPDFAAGFLLSQPLIKSLAERWLEKKSKMDFTIDPKHELAKFIWDDDRGPRLTDIPELCAGEPDEKCATNCEVRLPDCGAPVPKEKIFFAIKTCEQYHTERVPVVQKTWGQDAMNIEYYSEKEDSSIPTIDLGVPNTVRGHCGKFLAILKRVHSKENLSKIPWLVVADDDTLLSVSRLQRLLACYNPEEKVALGERYGYGTSSGLGYDYITGGGGMVLSQKTVSALLDTKTAYCPSDESPDDMLLGTWLKRLDIPIIHSPLFHQVGNLH
ncbi:beta-1,3-glucosyltransferase isoform X2 [Lingula anatina]|uniref:Beta-1,3-glucosyltransferase isoform X2 n=1 Tax=Lingula anatina TaxID=7574 RepID=A0A1S3HB60_LINAN|nr:beta-1,3-glucosyltransferase isoform X2 [Lingula anatina]|eukprot:XP_013383275.1 beta-1,3-glucosyltransferase isoform X2 [Lingula anatina]